MYSHEIIIVRRFGLFLDVKSQAAFFVACPVLTNDGERRLTYREGFAMSKQTESSSQEPHFKLVFEGCYVYFSAPSDHQLKRGRKGTEHLYPPPFLFV